MSPVNTQDVGERLRAAMATQNLTLFQVAKRTGVSQRVVRRALEGGLVSMSDALKLSVGLARRVG